MNRTTSTLLAGVLTAGALAAGAAAPATAAGHSTADGSARAAAYSVSIKVNDTEPDLKDTIKVKGTVGPGSVSGSVKLQVRYEGQNRWKNVDAVTLRNGGKYTFREKVKTVRERTYRVVKPASGRRGTGVSDKVKVTVYAWRDLTTLQPATVNGIYEEKSVALNGTSFSDSLVEGAFYPGRPATGTVEYNLNRDCTDLTGVAGLSDSSPVGGTSTVAIATDGVSKFSQAFGLTQSAPVALDVTDVFRVSFSTTSQNGGRGAVGEPQVRCSF